MWVSNRIRYPCSPETVCRLLLAGAFRVEVQQDGFATAVPMRHKNRSVTASAQGGSPIQLNRRTYYDRVEFSPAGYLARDGIGRGTGHSLGLEVHEQPVISRLNDTFLAPGMVITIEPGVYLPKKFGVRIEDTVLIKKKSYEVLTK